MFEIAFLSDMPSETARLGLIRIGTFEERFEASLSYWNEEQYQRQWCAAVARVLQDGETSCLITSIRDPLHANFVFWWPIYLDHDHGDEVVLQNHVLFLDKCAHPFDPSSPYRNVPPRSRSSEDGAPISEWRIPLVSLKRWWKASCGAEGTSLPRGFMRTKSQNEAVSED